jgi:hypothetical protein
MRGWVRHVDFTVSDLERSGPFYNAVLSFLGYHQSDKGDTWIDWDVGAQHGGRQSQLGWHDTIDPTIAIPAGFITWLGSPTLVPTSIASTICSLRLELLSLIRRRTIPNTAQATTLCSLRTPMD